MSNEMSDLDGIVMQNKLRISYSFIGEQGHPRAIGKYDVPSVWAFQSFSLHGTGTLRHPNSSGAVAISKTARTAAMRLLPTLIWLSVRWSRRRANESGSLCVGAVVHTPEWGSLPSRSRRPMAVVHSYTVWHWEWHFYYVCRAFRTESLNFIGRTSEMFCKNRRKTRCKGCRISFLSRCLSAGLRASSPHLRAPPWASLPWRVRSEVVARIRPGLGRHCVPLPSVRSHNPSSREEIRCIQWSPDLVPKRAAAMEIHHVGQGLSLALGSMCYSI